MLPQTIGPFYSEKARRAAVSVLTKAEAVFCRDPISTEITRKLVPNINLFESVDMALFMKFNKQKSSSEKIRVGINPSGLLWNGGYTKNNQFGLKDSYPDVIKRIVSYFTGFKNIQVELIGHVLAGPYYNYIEDDYRVCKLLQKQYQDCIVAPYFYSPIEAKSYISGLDFLTGSRMHCCIAAYSSGVPVFPLAYSRKFAGLFNDGLRYSHLSDLTNDNVEVVLNKLEHSYLSCSEIARTMPERIASLDEYRSTFVNNLTRIIEKIL
jgi:polysaccharide pyruvyl transferase WcaK-like protein